MRLPRDADDRAWTSSLADEAAPRLYRTVNPGRAAIHLADLDKRDPAMAGEIAVVRGADLGGLLPTPLRGDNSRAIVIIARNVEEMRQKIIAAASAGLLENKQVALITCGDAYKDTAALTDALLQNGAHLVWAPNRLVSEAAAEQLAKRILDTHASLPAARKGITLDEVIDDALRKWQSETPNDADLKLFLESTTWAVVTPEWEREWSMSVVRIALA
jgi:hypothetical protein